MDVFHIFFGNSWDSYFLESSWWKSLNQRLQNYLFFVCRGQCYNIFWQGIVLPCFFSQKIVSLRENSLKICKTVRNEEPTVRTWQRQWNHVTLGETVRVERSVLIKIIFSISILSSNFRIWLDLNNGLEWDSQTENSYFLKLSFVGW